MLAAYLGMFREWRRQGFECADLPFELAVSSAAAIAFTVALCRDDLSDDELVGLLGTVLRPDANSLRGMLDGAPGHTSYRTAIDAFRTYVPDALRLTLRDVRIITGRDVHFLVTRLDPADPRASLESTHLSPATHPNMLLADAVYCSSSVPFVAEPMRFGDGAWMIDGDLAGYRTGGGDVVRVVGAPFEIGSASDGSELFGFARPGCGRCVTPYSTGRPATIRRRVVAIDVACSLEHAPASWRAAAGGRRACTPPPSAA